jgi:hypothetical protein
VGPYLSGMQNACAVLYCHLWPLWLYRIFPHYLTNSTIFGGGGEGGVIERKMRVLILLSTSKYFSF